MLRSNTLRKKKEMFTGGYSNFHNIKSSCWRWIVECSCYLIMKSINTKILNLLIQNYCSVARPKAFEDHHITDWPNAIRLWRIIIIDLKVKGEANIHTYIYLLAHLIVQTKSIKWKFHWTIIRNAYKDIT